MLFVVNSWTSPFANTLNTTFSTGCSSLSFTPILVKSNEYFPLISGLSILILIVLNPSSAVFTSNATSAVLPFVKITLAVFNPFSKYASEATYLLPKSVFTTVNLIGSSVWI